MMDTYKNYIQMILLSDAKACQSLTKPGLRHSGNTAFPKGDSGNMSGDAISMDLRQGRAEMTGNRDFVMNWRIFLQAIQGAKGRTLGKLL